jgi:hypothetical protein
MAKKKRKARKTSRKKTSRKSPKKKTARKKRGKRIIGTWTKDDVKLLRKLYGSNPTADVAKQLKRGVDAVKKKAARMGLKKTKTYMKKLAKSRRKK